MTLNPMAGVLFLNYTDKRIHCGANGLFLANIGNSEIQWETTAKASIGLDAIFFNDRLSVTADLYNNKTKDLLFLKSLFEG